MTRPRVRQFALEYANHFALNAGQALQGVRHWWSHPDIDPIARRGTAKHALLSARLRSKRVVNDVFFALIPPHWHHTKEELASLASVPAARWFQYGYCAWRFTESGEPKVDLAGIDERWDPRCQKSSPDAAAPCAAAAH